MPIEPKYKKFADIIKPAPKATYAAMTAPAPATRVRRHSRVRIFAIGTLAVIFVGAAGYLTIIAELRNEFLSAKKDIAANMHDVGAALKSFDMKKANESLAAITRQIDTMKSQAQSVGIFQLFTLGGKLFPVLNAVPGALDDFVAFSGAALGVSEELAGLQSSAFQMMFGGRGHELVTRLDALDQKISAMITLANRLQASAATVRVSFPSDYLALMTELYRNQTLLQGARELLGTVTPTHLAILFQNPSEMRPTGGFIGSYAVVTIQDGSVTNIDVRDIYDPDGQLDIAVLPPRPLQAITGRWGARDANWFFDFPTSAAKVLDFLEKSKIYSERGTTFAGAIALNVHLIEDVLTVVGPIELAEYQKTVTAENFLAAVQTEVESGADKAAGTPKRILSVLTPMLFERLASASSDQKRALTQMLRERVRHKDLMIYAADRTLEAYIQNAGLGGELYTPEARSTEDYLAVVDTNIAGGKSDAFINESVALESHIDVEGRVINRLTVTRAHTGANQTEWWYRAPNKNFIQVLTPFESRLTTFSGHDGKIPDAPLVRPSYLRDADVQAIEQSAEWLPEFKAQQYTQFGKTTFAAWLTVNRGEKKTLVADYELERQLVLASDVGYRFVFERQSGTNTKFSYRVEAPPGFIWKENSATTYTFETENPESRTVLDLTLMKL
ncbi:MAG: DUF4012 domain-containing protein [bacterium]|nr:DUF4012 domain-containing protein [bacterium]